MTVKCSVFIATSLDGYIARKDGNLDWLVGSDQTSGQLEEGADYGYREFFGSIDTLVMGRNTYDAARSFTQWPYTGKRVVVLSSGSPEIPDELSDEVVTMSGAPPEVIRQLEEAGTRHIYVDGGRTIQSFLNAGLIDEMTITCIPVLIGDGIPLFGPLEHDIKLEHLHTTAYEDGFVQSKYKVIK